MKPVREIKAIKTILVNIKRNLKKQADDWRDNWEFIVNADSQKSLPQKKGQKFILKKDNKPKINLKHLAHYMLSWIACIDDYYNLYYIPKTKHSKYPKRMNWDDSEKKFQNIQKNAQMAPNRSVILRTVNSNTWKIHDRKMSEWITVVGMHKELLPMACPKEN